MFAEKLTNLRSQNFVHFEHVNLVDIEHCPEVLIAHYLSSVSGILKFFLLDVHP